MIGSVFIILIIVGRIIYSKVIKPRIEIGNKILKNKKMKDPPQQQLLFHQIDAFSSTNNNYGTNISDQEKVLKIQKKLNPYDWLIKSSEVQIVKKIGSGAFGNVYFGKLRGTTEIAIKVANPSTLSSSSPNNSNDSQIIEEFSRELSIWSSLKHPNIVLFIGACIDPIDSSIMIVSEYMQNGTLNDAFKSKKIVLDWNTKIRISLQVSCAMAYLHSRTPPLLHRDLKGDNILLNREMVAKVGDFGLSKMMSIKEGGGAGDAVAATQTITGTPYWMSPEVIRGERYGTSADVYSFAIILWQILSEKSNPYEDDVFKVQYKVVQGMRPEIPSDIEAIGDYHLKLVGKKAKQEINRGGGRRRGRGMKKKITQSNKKASISTSINDNNNDDDDDDNTYYLNLKEESEEPEDQKRIEMEEMKEKIAQFIELMKESWDSDPNRRPSFIEIGRRLEEMFYDAE